VHIVYSLFLFLSASNLVYCIFLYVSICFLLVNKDVYVYKTHDTVVVVVSFGAGINHLYITWCHVVDGD